MPVYCSAKLWRVREHGAGERARFQRETGRGLGGATRTCWWTWQEERKGWATGAEAQAKGALSVFANGGKESIFVLERISILFRSTISYRSPPHQLYLSATENRGC